MTTIENDFTLLKDAIQDFLNAPVRTLTSDDTSYDNVRATMAYIKKVHKISESEVLAQIGMKADKFENLAVLAAHGTVAEACTQLLTPPKSRTIQSGELQDFMLAAAKITNNTPEELISVLTPKPDQQQALRAYSLLQP